MTRTMLALGACIIRLLLPGSASSQWQRLGPAVPNFTTYPGTDPLIAFAGNMRSEDGGVTWKIIPPVPGATYLKPLAFVQRFPGRMYHATTQDTVLRSDDWGQTFQYTAWPRMQQLGCSITTDTIVGIRKTLNAWIWHTSFFRSIDGGRSWQRYEADDVIPFRSPHHDSSSLAALAPVNWRGGASTSGDVRTCTAYPRSEEERLLSMHPIEAVQVAMFVWHFYEDTGQNVVYVQQWFRLSDSAALYGTFRKTGWDNSGGGRTSAPEFAKCIGIHPDPGSIRTYIVQTEDETKLTRDKGTTWTLLLADSSHFTALAVDWKRGMIYCGTNKGAKYPGVWWSGDSGASWHSMLAGLTNLEVSTLHLDWKGRLYAVTGDGLYRWDGPVGIEPAGPGAAASAVLHGNYPNPFTGRTSIEFNLPERDRATLEVFDVLGRKLATLVDAELPAGRHSSVWRPDEAPASAMYYCRLRTSRGSAVIPLVRTRGIANR
jgi:hypothetical protein